MPPRGGPALILVGSAVTSPAANAAIRLMLIATALACIGGARAVHAQAAPAPSWGDVGVNWSPVFWLEDLDVDDGTPPGVSHHVRGL